MADGNTPGQQKSSAAGAGAGAGTAGETETTRRVYFCYQCNNTITEVLEDFTCPTCHSGFIEEREEPVGGADPFSIGGDDDNSDFVNFIRGLMQVGNLPQQQQQQQQGGGQQQQPQDPTRGRGRGQGRTGVNIYNSQDGSSLYISMNPQSGARVTLRSGSEGGEQQARQTGNTNIPVPVGDVIHTFLNDLMTGLHGPGAQMHMTGGGGLPMMGNFQDYAWGANGLDAIVTQLMNQMEGSGPPPLSDDKLAKIENVQISQDLVDKKLQCSVCWDDFILNEDVKKLECEHVFHEGCIVPWLKLHGTCPICRKDFTGEGHLEEESRRDPPATAPAGLFNMPLFPQQPQRTSQSNPSTPQPQNQQYSNNPANSNNPSSRGGMTLGFGPFQIPIPNFSPRTQTSSNNSARNNSSTEGSGRNQDHSNNSNSNRSGPNNPNPNNRIDDLDDEFD